DLEASVTRPVSALKAFARVAVPAGESRTVTFPLHAGQFGFHGLDMEYVVEPGGVARLVGGSAGGRQRAGRFTSVDGGGSAEVELCVGGAAGDRQRAGRCSMMDGGGSAEVAFQGGVTIRSNQEEED